MRLLVLAVLLVFAAARLTAAEPANVPTNVTTWLQSRTQAAAADWQAELDRTIQSGTWAERSARQRAYLLNAIGGLPAKRFDLNAHVQSVRDMPGYRIESVRYASQPGLLVTASLYLPASASASQPVPGVLIPCGHAQVAKAFFEYQAAAALLALNGIAALVYDPLDQGERIQRFDANGEVISDGVNAHMQEGMAALLLGHSLARTMVWEGIRSTDYLASRPEVDASRLGVTGHSGGGTLTAFLHAVDPRLKVAAPCCYISQAHFELWQTSTGGEIDSEQLLFGQLAQGFEHADFFLTRPAGPVLLLAATRDTNDITSTWATFRSLKRAFTSQGFSERIALVEDDVPHSYSQKHREAMVEWMLRWLAGEVRSVSEPEITILPERELFATPDGQVLRLPGARSIWDLFREEAARLARERGQPTGDELRRRIRVVTGIDGRPIEASFASTAAGSAAPRGYRVQAWQLAPANRQVPVEIIVWEPLESSSPPNPNPVLVCASQPPAADFPSLAAFVRDRRTIVIARALGASEQGGSAHDVPMDDVGNLTNADWVALYVLGESPVRHRAEDVLLVARQLVAAGIAKHGQVDLVAEGVMAVPGLHAAVLAGELIDHVTLRHAPQSWGELFTLERSYGMRDNFVPGVLQHYDLTDLTTALGDRLTILAPVNLLNLEVADAAALADPSLDVPTRPGLVGLLFGSGDLRNPREVDVRHETRGAWTGRGMSWSAEWQGFLLGPVDGVIEFEATSNRQVELIIADQVVLSRTAFPGTARGRIRMRAGEPVPVILRFLQSEGNEGNLTLSWSWSGNPKSVINAAHLRHTPRQWQAVRAEVRR